VISDFQTICIGKVCQESEDLAVPLGLLSLRIDMFHLIFNCFCHVGVAHFVSCFDDEQGGS